ncbi:type IV secretory system conjugative DNA transfer family protein [Aneurinibacillus tyrosinisolvens]|uniref:type IV secretory system conjugative DNA transfer family protein n=1 Tax=Aneurinibacillus tyrosinisolvens TaxID=1443435 RepID=UPI00063F97D5|nr:type IV secretory system conjugative DNA transfer family protein [Aneurinibacillus tyrosinisolvens]
MAEAEQQPLTTQEPTEPITEKKKRKKRANKTISVFTPAQYRTWRIQKREKWLEWYRLYFHTVASLVCVFLSFLLGYSGLMIYLSHLNHSDGSAISALSLFMNHPPFWLTALLGAFVIPIDRLDSSWAFFFITLIPVFTWCYTTITQPITKGYKTIISWKSLKGRNIALAICSLSFMCMYCGFIGWYIDTNMFDFFASIHTPQPFLVVSSMESFGYILLYSPVFLCLYGIYMTGKEFYQNEDLRKQYETWEFSPLARQSFNLTDGKCDVIVGWDKKNKKPIVIKETNRMLHELICGATGSGKSSTAILIRIVQDLIRIARGQKMGVVILEPKGDLVSDVLKLAKKLGIPDSKIKVVDPINLAKSVKFNPLSGPDMSKVAETFKGTLNALAGDQDAFFKGQQEEIAGFYVLLGKIFFNDNGRDNLDIRHLQQMFTDPAFLAQIVERLRTRIDDEMSNPATTKERQFQLATEDGVVRYFEDQVLSYKTFRRDGVEQPLMYPAGHRYAGRQQVESKKDAYITGGKKYLNELAMNQLLSQLFIPEEGEETLDLDKFLEEGGILLVNTALGTLDEMSLLFGQFFIRQFQSAVFRRPPEEDENGKPTGYKRIPIFFTIDEFPLYINEAFERMLTLGRSYRVGTLIALQSLGQLDSVRPGYDKVIKSNARNKTVFGGGEKDDNQWFSEQFGEEYQIEESLNESTTPVTVENQTWGFRHNTQRSLVARFSPTYIMELPFKNFIIQLIDENNSIQPPVHAVGKFVSETKYISKFVDVGKGELSSESDKPFSVGSHLNYYKQAISTTLQSGIPNKKQDTINEQQPTLDENGNEKNTVVNNSTNDDPMNNTFKSTEGNEEGSIPTNTEPGTVESQTNDGNNLTANPSDSNNEAASNTNPPADQEHIEAAANANPSDNLDEAFGIHIPNKNIGEATTTTSQEGEDVSEHIKNAEHTDDGFTAEHSRMDQQQEKTVQGLVQAVGKEVKELEPHEGEQTSASQSSEGTDKNDEAPEHKSEDTPDVFKDFVWNLPQSNGTTATDPENPNKEKEPVTETNEPPVKNTVPPQQRHAAASYTTDLVIEEEKGI